LIWLKSTRGLTGIFAVSASLIVAHHASIGNWAFDLDQISAEIGDLIFRFAGSSLHPAGTVFSGRRS